MAGLCIHCPGHAFLCNRKKVVSLPLETENSHTKHYHRRKYALRIMCAAYHSRPLVLY